jgi:membrane-associated phospholipid phosphatase
MLVVIAGIVPAFLVVLITLLFVPGGRVRKTSTRSQVWRLKLWELEKGLAGLCLSLATAFFITQGMKNMFGKPRPSLLARCQPDLDLLTSAYQGGYGQDVSMRWTLVDSSICTQTDDHILQDGFRSFPSGHSSWSWSGLLYLTLYVCSKFAIGLPHLPVIFSSPPPTSRPRAISEHELLPLHARHARNDSDFEPKRSDEHDSSEDTAYHRPSPIDRASNSRSATAPISHPSTTSRDPLYVRNAAAAPPNYLIIFALAPIGAAVYICSTRYAEFYHFGFDIIFGSLIGIATAWLSFRWYHLPIGRGQGWAWGARSKKRAFTQGVGVGGWVGEEGWSSASASAADVDVANRV